MNQRIHLAVGKEPPREFRLFSWGLNDTMKGPFFLTRSGAAQLMLRYREHGVDVMLDYEHMSLSKDATPEQKKRSGSCDLELRDDGLWITNITWTPQATQHLRNSEYRYLSPAFNVNEENEIIELINVALTNLPATHNQEALVAASATTTERSSAMKMSEHLKHHLSKHGGIEGLSAHLGMAKEKLSKHLGGEPMNQEEMKSCAQKLGLSEHDLEDEKAPIDVSYNGQDVNKTEGGGQAHAEAAATGFLETTGAGEAKVPTKGGEASEDQSGMLKMSREAVKELVTASQDLVKLQAEVDTTVRLSLIEKHKAKLTPRLIALSRKIRTADLREFLEALPDAQVELHEPKPTTTAGGARMVTLTREDKEVAKLSGKTEDEFVKLKDGLGLDERTITLAGEMAFRGQRPAPAADKAEKSNWDRKYADHFVTLSLTDRTPDGKPWKPAHGSKFKPASILPAE